MSGASESNGCKDFFGIDGEPIVLCSSEIFSKEMQTLQIPEEIQDRMAVRQPSPENFEDRIIFMSLFNDINWTKKGNYNECFSNSDKVKDFAKKISVGTFGLFSVQEEKTLRWNAQLQT